ncbi:hypothetical protein LUZ60_004982 [Juncus effusus]|nr:hypothetical protein LUZ60_004982 [Juncus effusus]
MYFFMQMRGFCMNSICLPEKLTEKFAPLVGKYVNLKLPNGASWRVGLAKCGSKLELKDGWCDFVRNNSISLNDLLFFKFKGGSEFEVVILDWNEQLEKSIGRDGIKIEYEDLEERIEKNQADNDEFVKFSSSEAENSEGNSNNSDLNETEEDLEEEGESGKNRYKKFQRFYPKEGVVTNFHEFYSPQGLIMTKEQIKKTNKLSEEIKKGNPTFLQVLRPVHITSRFSLSVPRHFCKGFLPMKRKNIILRLPDKKRKWTVICNYNKKHHEFRWIEFVRENNLLEGDICLFELDKNAEIMTFIVHVTRV